MLFFAISDLIWLFPIYLTGKSASDFCPTLFKLDTTLRGSVWRWVYTSDFTMRFTMLFENTYQNHSKIYMNFDWKCWSNWNPNFKLQSVTYYENDNIKLNFDSYEMSQYGNCTIKISLKIVNCLRRAVFLNLFQVVTHLLKNNLATHLKWTKANFSLVFNSNNS